MPTENALDSAVETKPRPIQIWLPMPLGRKQTEGQISWLEGNGFRPLMLELSPDEVAGVYQALAGDRKP